MQWALIFIFVNTGVYDTELRFSTYEECSETAYFLASEMPEDAFSHNPFQWEAGKGLAKCIPTK